MKRVLSVCVIFLYLLTSTGMTISVDYCMGEASGFSIDHIETDDDDDCCQESCACCTSKTAFVKMDDSQQRTGSNPLPDLFPAILDRPGDPFLTVPSGSAACYMPGYTDVGRSCPLYLYNNNFRI